ncbi:MAG: hypothetical protein ACRD1Z_07245 [Vicinamibacteria bacterium]
MNPHDRHGDNDEMRSEYDFSQGVRGKHYQAYGAGSNVVFLDSDVAGVFVDSASVNEALRLLVKLAKTHVPVKSRPKKLAAKKRRPRGARGSRG